MTIYNCAKEWAEGQQAGPNKKPGITILYLPTELRPEGVKQDKGHFIIPKDTIPSEDITDINYSPNKKQPLWFVVVVFPQQSRN